LKKLVLLIYLTLSLTATGAIFAQAPGTFIYQGRITNIAGEPITDSTTVVFTIYPDSVEGFPLWTEILTVVPDAEGVFTVELGTKTILTSGIFNGEKRYLGLKVGLDPEMVPRQLLTSGPYSLNTADIGDNSVTTDKIAPGAVGASDLAPNSVNSANVQNGSLTDQDILNEPGLGFKVSVPTATFRSLPADTTALDSISMTVPSAGFVLVWAHTNVAVDHENGITDEIYFQVAPYRDSILANDNGFAIVSLPAELPTQSTGWYIQSVDFHRPFVVNAAGTYKYYFNAVVRSGSGDNDSFYNLQLTAMFFPTYYGGTPIPSPGDLLNNETARPNE
jgi:hypothetical protein